MVHGDGFSPVFGHVGSWIFGFTATLVSRRLETVLVPRLLRV